jgi:hypothetical protein
MTTPRAAHTATRLLDGRVLIAGGCTASSCETGSDAATAELFDPATSSFARTGDLGDARVGHAAARLADGRVLLVGGFTATAVTATSEIYDPTTGRFDPGPTLRAPRADALLMPSGDGDWLVIGGFDGSASVAAVERLDTQAMAFVPATPLTEPRSSHAGAVLDDGTILVTGGGGEGPVVATAERYDPTTGGWTRGGPMAAARHKHAVAALPGGAAVVLGGSDERDGHGRYDSVEVYDGSTRRFSTSRPMAAARYKLDDAVAVLDDGRVLVVGGARRPEVFTPATREFRAVGPDLGAGWSFSTATALGDGSVLVAGGYDSRIELTAAAWVVAVD